MINVTCAVIRNEENEVLIVRRGQDTDHPLKWEFPGGKVAPGETEEECIIREVQEELSMEIVICRRLTEVDYDYGHKQIRLIPFICDTLDELPVLSEHVEYKWLLSDELSSVDFSEADVFVAKEYAETTSPHNLTGARNYPENVQSMTDDLDLQSMVNNMMSLQEAEWVAVSAIENPAVFLKLLDFSFSLDKKLAFRASWTLSKVCDKFPEIINPYLSRIVNLLNTIDNESALRSFLRIISLSDLEKLDRRQHGILADFCFTELKSVYSAIAVKAYSMEVLFRLSVIYPELANELSESIMVLMSEGSAGITSRGRMILKKLAELPINPRSNQL